MKWLVYKNTMQISIMQALSSVQECILTTNCNLQNKKYVAVKINRMEYG